MAKAPIEKVCSMTLPSNERELSNFLEASCGRYMYHGVPRERLKKIAKAGSLQAVCEGDRSNETCEPGIYLAMTAEMALRFAMQKRDGAIFRLSSSEIPRCAVEGDPNGGAIRLSACEIPTDRLELCPISEHQDPLLSVLDCNLTGWFPSGIWEGTIDQIFNAEEKDIEERRRAR